MAESSGRLGKGSGSGPGKGAVSADQVRSAEGAGGPAGPEKARAAGPRPASPGPRRGPRQGRVPAPPRQPRGPRGGGKVKATPPGCSEVPGLGFARPDGRRVLPPYFSAPRTAAAGRAVTGWPPGPETKVTAAVSAEPRDAHT